MNIESLGPEPQIDPQVRMEELMTENKKLRFLLACRVAGSTLYGDDGELSDCSEHPFIDFKRDDPDTLQAKLITRNQKRLAANPNAANAEVVIDYTNWRGQRSLRRIRPNHFYFGTTVWHPESGWLLNAKDMEKSEERVFAVKDIHNWNGSVEWFHAFMRTANQP